MAKFSLRIIDADYYLAKPINDLDVTYSYCRQRDVSKVPIIRIFGSTPKGQKCCLHVHNMFPYFYVLVPELEALPMEFGKQFASSLDMAIQIALGKAVSKQQEYVYSYEVVRKIPLYGYHHKEKIFLKVYLYNPGLMNKVSELLVNSSVMNQFFQPFETHIPFLLQFLIDYNLHGMNLINLSHILFRKPLPSGTRMSSNELRSPNRSILGSPTFSQTNYDIFSEATVTGINLLSDEIARQSTCELECDIVEKHILNKNFGQDNTASNPGLKSIWDDEKQRRRLNHESSIIEVPTSQDRSQFEVCPYEKDQLLWMQQHVAERVELAKGQPTSSNDMSFSQSVDGSNKATSSFNHSISSSDDTLLDILVDMANETQEVNNTPLSETTLMGNGLKEAEEEKGNTVEEEDEEENVMMSQTIHGDDVPEGHLNDTEESIEKQNDSWTDSFLWEIPQAEKDSGKNDSPTSKTIPQLDGNFDEADTSSSDDFKTKNPSFSSSNRKMKKTSVSNPSSSSNNPKQKKSSLENPSSSASRQKVKNISKSKPSFSSSSQTIRKTSVEIQFPGEDSNAGSHQVIGVSEPISIFSIPAVISFNKQPNINKRKASYQKDRAAKRPKIQRFEVNKETCVRGLSSDTNEAGPSNSGTQIENDNEKGQEDYHSRYNLKDCKVSVIDITKHPDEIGKRFKAIYEEEKAPTPNNQRKIVRPFGWVRKRGRKPKLKMKFSRSQSGNYVVESSNLSTISSSPELSEQFIPSSNAVNKIAKDTATVKVQPHIDVFTFESRFLTRTSNASDYNESLENLSIRSPLKSPDLSCDELADCFPLSPRLSDTSEEFEPFDRTVENVAESSCGSNDEEILTDVVILTSPAKTFYETPKRISKLDTRKILSDDFSEQGISKLAQTLAQDTESLAVINTQINFNSLSAIQETPTVEIQDIEKNLMCTTVVFSTNDRNGKDLEETSDKQPSSCVLTEREKAYVSRTLSYSYEGNSAVEIDGLAKNPSEKEIGNEMRLQDDVGETSKRSQEQRSADGYNTEISTKILSDNLTNKQTGDSQDQPTNTEKDRIPKKAKPNMNQKICTFRIRFDSSDNSSNARSVGSPENKHHTERQISLEGENNNPSIDTDHHQPEEELLSPLMFGKNNAFRFSRDTTNASSVHENVGNVEIADNGGVRRGDEVRNVVVNSVNTCDDDENTVDGANNLENIGNTTNDRCKDMDNVVCVSRGRGDVDVDPVNVCDGTSGDSNFSHNVDNNEMISAVNSIIENMNDDDVDVVDNVIKDGDRNAENVCENDKMNVDISDVAMPGDNHPEEDANSCDIKSGDFELSPAPPSEPTSPRFVHSPEYECIQSYQVPTTKEEMATVKRAKKTPTSSLSEPNSPRFVHQQEYESIQSYQVPTTKEELVVLTPTNKAPTYQEVVDSLHTTDLQERHYLDAFYGNEKDNADSLTSFTGQHAVKCTTKAGRLPKYSSAIPSHGALEHFQKEQVTKLGLDAGMPGFSKENDLSMMYRFLYGEDRIVIKPCKSPPQTSEIKEWLMKHDKTKEKKKQKKMKPSDINIPHFVSPIPKMDVNKKVASPFTINRILNNSEIEGMTPNNTFSFDHTQANLNDAKALHIKQYLTVISVEIFCKTRRELKPDPQIDCIQAIFYTVTKETNDNGSTMEEGAFIYDPNHTENENSDSLKKAGIILSSCKCFSSEKDMFLEFASFIRFTDPDMILGYEVQMLSWGYIIERGAVLDLNMCHLLSRVCDKDTLVKSNTKENSENWFGQLLNMTITGRIILNVWRVMRSEVTLQIYSYENVAYHVLHRRVPFFSFQTLTDWWNLNTQRWRVFQYFMGRCQGNLDMLDGIDFINRTSELARVFGILFYAVISRGSQFRVESMMLRTAKPLNYVPVSPSVHQRAKMAAPECIPLVLEPESKFYVDPVIVLDFQSLYPSIIIAYNYCYSTCLGKVNSFVFNDNYRLGATTLNLPLNVLNKLSKDNIHITPNGVGFVTSDIKRGVLPRMLEEILNTRIMVKGAMKKAKDDKVLHRMLDSRQLGLKLIANVTYGYTSANFSGRMPCIEIGDSVVRKARETLERAIQMVNTTSRWDAKVVYGDTDSMFIVAKGASKERAFQIAQEIVDQVTASNPKPVKLKFEKVYQPCVLVTKKRYVGYSYESLDQKEPIFDAKGIETVRRDNCPAVGKILEKSIRVLFESKDVSLVKSYVQRQLVKIMEGKTFLKEFIIAKEYRGMNNYKPGACVPALVMTRKMLKQDRRSEPRIGQRVPYVIIHGSPGLPLIQLVRSPMYLIRNTGLRINEVYYATKQICPALGRIFSLLGVNVHKWFTDLPKINRIQDRESGQQSNTKGTISHYFNSQHCPVCQQLTTTKLCSDCRNKPQETLVHLTSRIWKVEKRNINLTKICQHCSRSWSTPTDCVSIDCPVFFKLSDNTKDMNYVNSTLRFLLEEIS